MKVLQLIDTLEAGGAERMAVNIANGLAKAGIGSCLCATRAEGILKDSLDVRCNYLFLNKRGTLDIKAIWRLKQYVRQHEIDVMHAHSTSFFVAVLLKFFMPSIRIVWHDHYGNSEHLSERKHKVLKLFSGKFDAIISVNDLLEKWARETLRASYVVKMHNFVTHDTSFEKQTAMAGIPGKRILCLANLRPQKDHITLLKAFKVVHERYGDWTLHLVGKNFKDDHAREIEGSIAAFGMKDSVFCYGSLRDIPNVIAQSTIGVLSSRSEGLPLTLLEYAIYELPVVATKVGQAVEVIPNKDHGILVPPSDHESLAAAIMTAMDDSLLAKERASNLKERVESEFSEAAVIEKLKMLYQEVLTKKDKHTIPNK